MRRFRTRHSNSLRLPKWADPYHYCSEAQESGQELCRPSFFDCCSLCKHEDDTFEDNNYAVALLQPIPTCQPPLCKLAETCLVKSPQRKHALVPYGEAKST